MTRGILLALGAGIFLVCGGCGLKDKPAPSAAQIIENSIQASGGAEAWRKVQTMVWVGHIQGRHTPMASMPFVLEMKRPDKTRFQIRVQNQVLVRMFDGVQGWTVHPARGGGPRFQRYTGQELRYARDAPGIGGLLPDHKARGVTLALEGIDQVDGRRAYRLRAELPSGTRRHIWIDARTFLAIRSDRQSRGAFGQQATVYVHYRNYQTVAGLKMPFRIESGPARARGRDVMVIDRVVLNPSLPDWVFSRRASGRRGQGDSGAPRRQRLPEPPHASSVDPGRVVPGVMGEPLQRSPGQAQ